MGDNSCPYCPSERFKGSYQGEDGRWRNKCTECGQWSAYYEPTDTQEALNEPERSNGDGSQRND